MFKNGTCKFSDDSQGQGCDTGHSYCTPCNVGKVLMVLVGLAILSAVLAGVAWSAPTETRRGDLALEGYCPVCVTKMGQWVEGSPAHQSRYDGKTYYFPSERERRVFLADPAKYVPVLGGDCTVCYAKMKKRVPGSIQHAAVHDGRVYLFPSEKEKKAFLDRPSAYSKVDMALDGNCAVCLAKAGKRVPGKSEFTAIHHGFRYLFPSDRERQAFVASPGSFSEKEERRSPRGITVSGTSSCAACEHGVTPIGAPNTLGLAINTPDGKVYVIENAHSLYPRVYKGRFGGLALTVSGEILKRDGRITWLRPSGLIARN